jgi:hypothetical protein
MYLRCVVILPIVIMHVSVVIIDRFVYKATTKWSKSASQFDQSFATALHLAKQWTGWWPDSESCLKYSSKQNTNTIWWTWPNLQTIFSRSYLWTKIPINSLLHYNFPCIMLLTCVPNFLLKVQNIEQVQIYFGLILVFNIWLT